MIIRIENQVSKKPMHKIIFNLGRPPKIAYRGFLTDIKLNLRIIKNKHIKTLIIRCLKVQKKMRAQFLNISSSLETASPIVISLP